MYQRFYPKKRDRRGGRLLSEFVLEEVEEFARREVSDNLIGILEKDFKESALASHGQLMADDGEFLSVNLPAVEERTDRERDASLCEFLAEDADFGEMNVSHDRDLSGLEGFPSLSVYYYSTLMPAVKRFRKKIMNKL